MTPTTGKGGERGRGKGEREGKGGRERKRVGCRQGEGREERHKKEGSGILELWAFAAHMSQS